MNTYAAVLGKKSLGSKVIGYIVNPPKGLKTIDIAGDLTDDGEAINVSTHRVSYSKVNIKKAEHKQPVSIHAKSGTYTFFAV